MKFTRLPRNTKFTPKKDPGSTTIKEDFLNLKEQTETLHEKMSELIEKIPDNNQE